MEVITRFLTKTLSQSTSPFRAGAWELRSLLRFVSFRLSQASCRLRFKQQACHGIAVIFIGIGKYIEYFPGFHASCTKFLLPKTSKTFFLFTDHPVPERFFWGDDVRPVAVETVRWPFPTLFRFRYIHGIAPRLQHFSHILYLDADMLVNAPITERDFFSHPKPLFGVCHPVYLHGGGPFETNRESRAGVREGDEGSTYYQGNLWGGKTAEVLQLCEELKNRIDDDLSRALIATWHDESHLNKYFIEKKEMIHPFNPEYAYPLFPNGVSILPWYYKKKILHLHKDHAKMREIYNK